MFDTLLTFLAQAAAEVSPVAEPVPPTDEPGGTQMLLMMGIIFAIFYFLILRPQQNQESDLKTQVDALKKNDRVVTSGGVIGIVQAVKEDEIVLRIDDEKNVKVRVVKNAIKAVLGDKSSKSNDKAKKS